MFHARACDKLKWKSHSVSTTQILFHIFFVLWLYSFCYDRWVWVVSRMVKESEKKIIAAAAKKNKKYMKSNKIRFGIGHCLCQFIPHQSHAVAHKSPIFIFHVVCLRLRMHTKILLRVSELCCSGSPFCMEQCTLYDVLWTMRHTVSSLTSLHRRRRRHRSGSAILCLFVTDNSVCQVPSVNLGKGCRLLIFNKNS